MLTLLNKEREEEEELYIQHHILTDYKLADEAKRVETYPTISVKEAEESKQTRSGAKKNKQAPNKTTAIETHSNKDILADDQVGGVGIALANGAVLLESAQVNI